MTHDELIEAAARSLWIADGFNPAHWDGTTGRQWAAYMVSQKPRCLNLARAAISVIAPAVLEATLKAQRDCEYPTDLPQWATRANLSRADYVCAWEDGSQAVEEAIRALKTRYVG